MPITVVTHRDDLGAPTNREVYAAGVRYRLDSSGLEIFGADRRVLALYPDGNWLSVYVDNSVRVHTEGRPEEEPVPRVGTSSASPDAAFTAAVDAPPGGELVAGADEVLEPDEILAREPAATAATGDTASGDGIIDAEEQDADDAAAPTADVAAADAPPATAERTNFPPPGMRPVTFRPRVLRPARRPEEPSRPTHMRPLVFRARTYRKRDE